MREILSEAELAPPIFLTFLILTYRRPQKLVRLLEQFLCTEWEALNRESVEIVIVDDHSEDDTKALVLPVLNQLASCGWPVRYIYRSTNLGADGNLLQGYGGDAKGEYVWIFCDDDILNINNSIKFIDLIRETKPAVGVCGFRQGVAHKSGNDGLKAYPEIIMDIAKGIDVVVYYPKTSAYVLRKSHFNDFKEKFRKWDGSLYSWIGLSIILIAEKDNIKVINFKEICAEGDDNYGELQYSYRVFANLHRVVLDALSETQVSPSILGAHSNFLLKANRDIYVLCAQGLQAHYAVRSEISYKKRILDSEKNFIRQNLFKYFTSLNRLISLLKCLNSYFGYFIRGKLGKYLCASS